MALHAAPAERLPSRVLCGLQVVHQGTGRVQRVLQPAPTLDPLDARQHRRPNRLVAPHNERQRKHIDLVHCVPAVDVRGVNYRTWYHLHVDDWRVTAGTGADVAEYDIH